jgi:ferritin
MKRVSDKVEALINLQIEHEQTNSLLYLAISNWANYEGWVGCSTLFKAHSEEEKDHRDIFINYLLDRDAMPITPSKTSIPIPVDFGGIEEIIELTLKREVETTESIKKIKYQTMEEKDCVTTDFLISMILEQRQEEADAIFWIDRLNMMKQTNTPLYFIDKEMAEKATK